MNKHLWIFSAAALLLGAGVGQADKDPVFLAEVKASDAVAARVGSGPERVRLDLFRSSLDAALLSELGNSRQFTLVDPHP